MAIIRTGKNFYAYVRKAVNDVKNDGALFENIGRDLEANIKDRWDQGQDSEGKSFEPLSAVTIELKGGNGGILQDTMEMYNSLFHKASKDSLRIGISDPKYFFHHSGTTKMPRRRVIPTDGLIEADLNTVADAIIKSIKKSL